MTQRCKMRTSSGLLLTEWILGDDGVLSVERLRLALRVDGLDPELVLVARDQVVHLHRRLGAAAGRHPAT